MKDKESSWFFSVAVFFTVISIIIVVGIIVLSKLSVSINSIPDWLLVLNAMR